MTRNANNARNNANNAGQQRGTTTREQRGSHQLPRTSVNTSKPAINDHFKTGQRSRTQDMKLFYRAEATSGKLFLISLLTHRAPSRPEGGRGNAFVFPS
jgi:hypothetical protein